MNTFPEHIERIVRAAAQAPSGDNSQPWRFTFRAPNTLEIRALPEKDNALFNIDDSGTLIALGAAIQNAELEAKALGFMPEVRYGGEGTLTATLVLQNGDELSEMERSLQQAIPLRHSNRKAYKKTSLATEDKQALLNVVGKTAGVSFAFIEAVEPMARVSRALTTMEEIALNNKSLHKLFFESIFWSKESNEEGAPGLYIKTLELPPPAQLLFKALRHWPVASFLARVGFPRKIAEMNAKQNASASAFGVITVDRFDRVNYIEAGRLLERVWLAAAARGMSLQIVTGILFLARTLEHDTSTPFSAAERMSVREASSRIRGNLEGSKEPLLIFRVGYGTPPSAVSFRKAPVTVSVS
jgi:nitroreductase